MNFIERLSGCLGKQYIFKQEKNTYWNRYIEEYQTKEEAQDWLIEQFNEMNTNIEEERYKENNNIKAIFVKSTNEIIYSRDNHDFRSSKDGKYAVDGGFGLFRCIFEELDGFIQIELDKEVLLEQILSYDYRFKNENASQWKEGYYGKFVLTPKSNPIFYKRLIVKGFNEVWKSLTIKI